MKKTKIFLGIGIAIIIFSVGIVFPDKIYQFIFHEEAKTTQGNIQENIKETVVLIIDDGEGSPKTIEAEFKEGMTAFDLLKEEIEEVGLALETKIYEEMGVFIEKVGAKKNGDDNKYWLYYVNAEMPQVAADKFELKAGDKIEFKFEKSPF